MSNFDKINRGIRERIHKKSFKHKNEMKIIFFASIQIN